MDLQIERLHKNAVDAAIANNWDTAISLNKQILEIDPENVDAHLGIGFAYLQSGNIKEAENYYKKALRIDGANVIARTNLDKIDILGEEFGSSQHSKVHVVRDPSVFVTILGKTKIVTLVNIGKPEVLAQLKIGELVELKIKKRRIEVRNTDGDHIGALPDDISKRLMYFLENHSEYRTYIKSSTKNSVDVFIKEHKKGPKVARYISFPANINDDMKTFITKDDDGDSDDEEPRIKKRLGHDGDDIDPEGQPDGDEHDPETEEGAHDDDAEIEDDETEAMDDYEGLLEGLNDDKDEDTEFFSQLDQDEDDDFEE